MMLAEPELTLVQAWLSAGNQPRRVPFGVSGECWNFGKTARQSGAWGSFRRYGGLHIEAEALPFIAEGQLTAAQARVGFVWALLRRRGPLTVDELADALRLSERTARATVRALVEMSAVEAVITAGPKKLRAVERAKAPHWTDYLMLPAEKRAA
jgi:hypothetical protein